MRINILILRLLLCNKETRIIIFYWIMFLYLRTKMQFSAVIPISIRNILSASLICPLKYSFILARICTFFFQTLTTVRIEWNYLKNTGSWDNYSQRIERLLDEMTESCSQNEKQMRNNIDGRRVRGGGRVSVPLVGVL